MSWRTRLPLDGKPHFKVCNIPETDLQVSCILITPMCNYISAIHTYCSFYTEQIKTPSSIDYIFADSALSSLSIKDNSDQLSQACYEDEVSESDTLVSGNTSTPISSSITSSGYYSGGSYVDGSVSLKSIQPPFSESTGRVLSSQENKQEINEEFPTPSIANPIQDTHETTKGLSSSDSSENVSICTQREFTSPTDSCKAQPYSKESPNSCKKNISNTQTLLVDSSVHKSIYAMSKSTRSPTLIHPSNGQASKLTPWLVLCIIIIINLCV